VTDAVPEVVRVLAEDADLMPLWQAVHRRLCAGDAPDRLATVKVDGMSSAGIAVLRGLLDTTTRRTRGSSAVQSVGGVTRVPLREFLTTVGVAAAQLQLLVEVAVGRAVVNRAHERAAGTTARRALWATVETNLAAVPSLARRIRAAGVSEPDIPLIEAQSEQLGAALARIATLRAPASLAKLAHDCAGTPHAFDLGTLTGRRLVEAIAEVRAEAVPERPDAVRAMLARARVLADRLSTSVLLLNVWATGPGVVDQRLRLGGGPVPVTLYDLTVNPPILGSAPLLVVENPSVLEAAMAAGHTAPLACTSGHLGAVDHTFLQRAVECGVPLSYAGDIDRDGLIIARQVHQFYGAAIMGMDADIVRRAGRHASATPLGPLPDGVSPGLASALAVTRRAVFQENDVVLDRLLARKQPTQQ